MKNFFFDKLKCFFGIHDFGQAVFDDKGSILGLKCLRINCHWTWYF